MRQNPVREVSYAFGKGIKASTFDSINIESVMRELRSDGARQAGQNSAHIVMIGRSKE